MKTHVAFIFLVFFLLTVKAQDIKPQLLKEPATWSFERFNLPPVFATNFPYKGIEELRFSPGMFNKDSSDYFTYAFVAQLDSITSITKNDIKNYLLTYYKGLCSSTANDRKLIVDTSKVTVAIKKKRGLRHNEIIYNALLHVFGVFVDGAAIKLNMEVKVITDYTAQKIYLLFVTSPHKKTDYIWKELYKIQKNFSAPR